MRVLAVGQAFPAHRVEQATIARALDDAWRGRGHTEGAITRLLDATGVETRYITLPLAAYEQSRSFGKANDAFIATATQLAAEAARDGLALAGLTPSDVDLLMVVTTTGVAAPSLDARLMNLLGFRRDVRRVPVVGLGCVGGAAGIARCAEYVGMRPDAVALLICVELCSLTFQLDDPSASNLVATGLFGDAAAAAVITHHTGAERPGVRILDSLGIFQRDTEDVLGFAIGDSGFRVVLGNDLPEVAARGLPAELDAFLAPHGLTRADVGIWVIHPGGPKVLRSIERVLELDTNALRFSRDSLRRIGNVSSGSVLCILRDVLETQPAPGTYGLLLAMGPGFSSETVLLQF